MGLGQVAAQPEQRESIPLGKVAVAQMVLLGSMLLKLVVQSEQSGLGQANLDRGSNVTQVTVPGITPWASLPTGTLIPCLHPPHSDLLHPPQLSSSDDFAKVLPGQGMRAVALTSPPGESAQIHSTTHFGHSWASPRDLHKCTERSEMHSCWPN